MICKNCGIENDVDALFCKRCGTILNSNYERMEKQDNKPKKIKNKVRTKTKVKNQKTKQPKQKVIYKQVTEKKSNFGTNLLLLFLIIIILGVLGIFGIAGYKYYEENYNIEVPNLIGMTYDEAKITLGNKSLQIYKKEIIVDDDADVGIVVKQNKKENAKVKKDTIITVTVGVLNNEYIVPNFIGKDVNDAIKILTQNNISYNIIYEPSDDYDKNVVIKQSIAKNKKITKDATITLTISTGSEENLTSKEIQGEEESSENIVDNIKEE